MEDAVAVVDKGGFTETGAVTGKHEVVHDAMERGGKDE